jgi:hypothetical protein
LRFFNTFILPEKRVIIKALLFICKPVEYQLKTNIEMKKYTLVFIINILLFGCNEQKEISSTNPEN